MKLARVILLIVGVAALICGGFSYSTHRKPVDMRPVQPGQIHHYQRQLPHLLEIVRGPGRSLVLSGSKTAR